MVRRFTPLFLAALALSVTNPLSAAPPAPPKPQEQTRLPAAKAPARPVGVWVRDVGPLKLVLKLTDDRLTATALYALNEEACPVLRVTFDAEYAVAKDGTLFGVIFGTDANHPRHVTMLEWLDGQPFAFGWRVDGETLTVRNLRCLGEGVRSELVGGFANFRTFVGGRYTRIDESKLPAWEKKFSDAGFQLDAQLGEHRPKPPVPPSFPGRGEAPTAMPGVPSAMTAPPQPPVIGVPLPPIGSPPQPLPTPAPGVVVPIPPGPVGVPSGFTNGRDLTNPSPAPSPTTPAVPTSLVGTWTRDVGAFRATFKFTPKQLVVHMHLDPTSKKDFQELIFVVEYKLVADGKRFEGTVIGADVKTSKDVAFNDADDKLRGAREFDDRPMRFELQIVEGLLLVRNVSFGVDGKGLGMLRLYLPGLYTLETEKIGVPAAVSKSGPVVGPFSPPPVVNSAAPREPDRNTNTTHVVEAPDILLIEVLKGVPKPAYQLEPLDVVRLQWADPALEGLHQDDFTIDPDGSIDLGTTYGGRVKIAGLTVAEAKLAIEKSFAPAKLKDSKLREIKLAELRSVQQINGQHLVRPDGTIGLGRYGSASVAGKPLADAKKAVEKHLSQYLLAPEVSVEVQGFNNKTETPRGSVPIVPAPAPAKSVERPGCKVETQSSVPVLPPLREGALPDAPPPPCIHEVLKALPPAPRGVPFIFEVSRENIEQSAWVVKELEADKLAPPRFYPLLGFAHLHHATWKCTVTFTETITSGFPFPFKTTRERVEVVRVPQTSLYQYVGPEAPAAPPVEPAKVSNGAGVVPASGTVPANPLHGTWVREQDGMQVVLTFTEKRLHVEINAAFAMPGEKGPPVRLTQSLDADYSTGPDGMAFGILTGIDVSRGEGLPPEAYASVKEARREFEKMIGAMFKFRTRLDGGRMTLSEARASMFDSVRGPTGDVKSDTNGLVGEIFGGRFERVTGNVPPPKPTAGGIINQYSEDPNVRIEQLQKPEGEQRQKGTGLVPPPSTPAPKCKDCAPPLKPTPGLSEPVAPIPMSRS